MWNNNIPEIISERPEEEDMESHNHEDTSQQGMRKSNKINKILESYKSQNSDYNSLFKEKTNNSIQNKPSPKIQVKERPSLLQQNSEDTV